LSKPNIEEAKKSIKGGDQTDPECKGFAKTSQKWEMSGWGTGGKVLSRRTGGNTK